jgi:tetratricopeptide (TPR) repeat protein
MNGELHYEEIHRYLLEEMDAHEKQAFEARMERDAALREEVQLERELQFLVRAQRGMEIKQVLREIHAEGAHEGQEPDNAGETSPSRKRWGIIRPPMMRWMFTVGSIAAILVAAILIFKPFGYTMDLVELVTEFDTEDPVNYLATARGTVPGNFEMVLSLMEADEFQQAYDNLDPNSTDDDILFARALALKAMKDYGRSIPLFEEVIESVEAQWISEATWELSMVELHTRQVEQAKIHLKWLVDHGGPNQEKAVVVLEKLEKVDLEKVDGKVR